MYIFTNFNLNLQFMTILEVHVRSFFLKKRFRIAIKEAIFGDNIIRWMGNDNTFLVHQVRDE